MSNENQGIAVALFALQKQLISEVQLLDALREWREHQDRSLEQILVESGAVLPAQLERLQNDDSLRRITHPERLEPTMPFLEAPTLTAVIENWASDATIALEEQTLRSMSLMAKTLDVASGRTMRADFSGDSSLGERHVQPLRYGAPDRYKIEKLHARGGLGDVSIATDLELNRQVAFKEIQARFSSDAISRERFIVEAQITGGLEHPGIVPVYGLGLFEDGRPFYAMRFIRGSSMKAAIDEFHATMDSKTQTSGKYLSLEFRQLLGRFISVCHAIEFAHSKGVVHLDIKPANIMLGEFGETLVVDWGLARSFNKSCVEGGSISEETLSRSGSSNSDSIAGTPAFMSPEQAKGDSPAIGASSDIYSLGASLYYLLLGQTAFDQKDLPSLLRAVIRGEFREPHRVSRHVPRSLNAICLKAMAAPPNERFSSARQLAHELERYMADEPSSVYREPLISRVRRWIRRHQAIASTTGMGVLATVVFLAIFSTALGAKNAKLNELNRSLDTALTQLGETNRDLETINADLVRANGRERVARLQANSDRAEAIKQSSFVLSTLAAVVIDLQAAIEQLPGGDSVRLLLLQTAMTKLTEISNDYLDHASVDRTTVIALGDLGDLAQKLGSDGFENALPEEDTTALTGLELADRFYRRALEISLDLIAEQPSDREYRRLLSVCYFKRGEIANLTGRFDEAHEMITSAHSIREELLAEFPTDTMIQYHYGFSCFQVGDMAMNAGKLEEALEHFREGVDVLRQAKVDLTDPDFSDDVNWHLSQLLSSEGLALFRLERITEAEKAFEEALAIRETLRTHVITDTRIESELAVSLVTLGDIRMANRDATAALDFYERSLGTRLHLHEQEPRNRIFARDVAISLDRKGQALLALKRIDDAEVALSDSVSRFESLLVDEPQSVELQQMRAMGASALGDLEMARREFGRAEGRYRDAQSSFQTLVDHQPSDVVSRRSLMIASFKLGEALRALRRPMESLESYRQALQQLEAIEESGADYPSLAREKTMLENSIRQVEGMQIVLGDWDRLIEQPAEVLPDMLEARAIAKLEAGEWTDAIQAARKLAELENCSASQLYNSACVASRYSSQLKSESNEAQAQMLANEAFELLKRSVAAGWSDMKLLTTDSDLDTVRELPAFDEWLQSLDENQ